MLASARITQEQVAEKRLADNGIEAPGRGRKERGERRERFGIVKE